MSSLAMNEMNGLWLADDENGCRKRSNRFADTATGVELSCFARV